MLLHRLVTCLVSLVCVDRLGNFSSDSFRFFSLLSVTGTEITAIITSIYFGSREYTSLIIYKIYGGSSNPFP
jgi:hypothetical protein